MKEYIYPYRIIRGISSPIIPIKIMKDDKIARVYAYVDSGATYSFSVPMRLRSSI
jgi:hypothetical protein